MTITAVLTVEVVSQWRAQVPMSLTYDAADPFAVRMQFGTVVWLIGRELLREGLDGPSGQGDVTFTPVDLAWIHMQLRSPHGQCLVRLPRVQLAAFLRATELAVPFGSETWGSLDEELSALLRKAAE